MYVCMYAPFALTLSCNEFPWNRIALQVHILKDEYEIVGCVHNVMKCNDISMLL